jgi:hypothetical protein
MANENFGSAKKAKNDEFYTQYSDIEKEINAYLDYDSNVFRGKTILLPCDDPEWSNFTKYFAQNFEKLGLKKLISTSFAPNSKNLDDLFAPTEFEFGSEKYDKAKSESKGRIFTLTRDTNLDKRVDLQDIEWEYLKEDGDFRSEELRKLRDESDIIITNPPFSLFRPFLDWVVEGKKKFLLIGNMNAITYKESFSLIKENKIWLGATNFNTGMYFRVPKSFVHSATYKFERERNGEKVNRVPGVCWFTNLDHGRRHQPLQLMSMERNVKFSRHKEIRLGGYKKYDNYEAIEVSFIDSIPSDYEGEMGVPITFLDKYNPDQFEIIGSFNAGAHGEELGARKVEIQINGKTSLWNGPVVEGLPLYKRIVIKHRKAAQ